MTYTFNVNIGQIPAKSVMEVREDGRACVWFYGSDLYLILTPSMVKQVMKNTFIRESPDATPYWRTDQPKEGK